MRRSGGLIIFRGVEAPRSSGEHNEMLRGDRAPRARGGPRRGRLSRSGEWVEERGQMGRSDPRGPPGSAPGVGDPVNHFCSRLILPTRCQTLRIAADSAISPPCSL